MGGITISGELTSSNGTVREASSAMVEIKKRWTDAWSLAPFLHFLGATVNTGREGPGTCMLAHPYGPAVKRPYEADFASVDAIDLRGYWVRISIVSANGVASPAWFGRITGETREVHATPTRPGGRQIFTALEPIHLLERIFISKSFWQEDPVGEEEPQLAEIGFVPDMNALDQDRVAVGNRSTHPVEVYPGGSVYVFGGRARWTRDQFIDYVLEMFAYRGDEEGPRWVLTGFRGDLAAVRDIIPMTASMSVADVLRKLIDDRIGLDFTIRPTEFSDGTQGFEVSVFALNAVETSFGGETMPRNPRTLTIQASNARQFERLTIVRDAAQRYGRIRVVGQRAICGLTLRGAIIASGSSSEANDNPTLVPRWPEALQTEYGAGGAGGEPAEQDKARRADKFTGVYQDFGTPDNWDHHGGMAAPIFDPTTGAPVAGTLGQRQVRRTLTFVPIEEEGGGGYMAPQAWVYDEEELRYVPAAKVGINILAPRGDWGLRLEATPNHLLGLNHFNAPTEEDPRFDYDKLVATLAIETDQRIELVYETGETAGADWKPSDGELVIYDDSAELWYLAPGTVTGVNQDGHLVTVEGDQPIVIRNDVTQLYRWMAGAIGRYINPRGRAELVLRGWHPYSHAVGAILAVIEEVGDSHQIQAPVTSVEYGVDPNGGGGQTIIRAGFAGS